MVWLVRVSNGENRLRAEVATRFRAWGWTVQGPGSWEWWGMDREPDTEELSFQYSPCPKWTTGGLWVRH